MSNAARSRRSMRWWLAIVILLLGIGSVIAVLMGDFFARQLLSIIIGIVTLGALVLWYVFCTGLPMKSKLKGLGASVIAVVLLGFVGASLLRFEGSSNGAAVPKLVPKWAPRADANLEIEPETEVTNVLEVTIPEGAVDFPQFLGKDRRGTVSGVALEADWEAHPPKEIWRVRVGLGWSGFAVVGGRAFTQEQRGDQELVTCYRLVDGELLWSHADSARFVEGMGGDGPRATPTVIDGRVYALGATGILNCLEAATGKLIWTVETLGSGENIEWGKSSSPLLVKDLVIVTGGREDSSMLAYHAADGKSAWASGTDEAMYASPVLAHFGGVEQVLGLAKEGLTSYRLSDGEILWNFDWLGNFPKSCDPVVVEKNRVLVCASYGMGSKMLEISNEGQTWKVDVVWESLRMKAKFSNVCVHQGYGYGLDEAKLSCIELDTGVRQWKTGRYGYGQNLLIGNLLLVQAEKGDVVLVNADPEHGEEIARIPALTSKTWNSPTVAGKFLLVRNDREAICFELPLK